MRLAALLLLVGSLSAQTNPWKRTGTTISPRRAGDSVSIPTTVPGGVSTVVNGVGMSGNNFLGARTGLTLGYVDDDTISVSYGGCVTPGGTSLAYVGGNITFTALDTGTRTVGKDYAAFLTADGPKLTVIAVTHAGGLVPTGYTALNSCLIGYFHNGKAYSLGTPTAPTAALAGTGAGSVNAGAHIYSVTFSSAYGESMGGILSSAVTVTDPATNGKVALSAIPLGPTGTLSRKIYGSAAGGVLQYYIGTIPDNTTATYTVNIADASLGAQAPITGATANPVGAIFQYSVTSNDKLNRVNPYRALQDLPAGVPLPGMVRIGGIAIGIYEASHEDATASAAGTSAYPVSRYGVVPWASIQGWNALATVANAGLRLPTWAEWLTAVQFAPGSSTPARMNGNTAYGSASDDAYLAPPGAPTVALAGTGAGLLTNGVYKYEVTLVNATGETTAGTVSGTATVADATTNGQIALSAIPTGAAGTTARKIWRTKAGGSTYYLLTTIADNTTTTYSDNTADASLPSTTPPAWNTTGVQQGTADPTTGGRTLTGSGPRTALNSTTAAGRSWYSPAGIADAVGNVWEWTGQFFGGLATSSPGAYVSWGFESDGGWNFGGQVYNPDTGGRTSGLPSMLLVGGCWSNGSYAGVRAASADPSAGYSTNYFGFRPAR